MKQFLRLTLLTFAIWIGYQAIIYEFGGIYVGVLGELSYLPFVGLILILIPIVLLDIKFYRNHKNLLQYIPSVLILIIISTVIYRIINRNFIDTSKTIFEITNMPGANKVIKIELKENGKFRLAEYDLFGQTFYYGKYVKISNQIKIIETNYTDYPKKVDRIGFIEKDTVFWNKFDTMLISKP